ncbi:MAG: hypothetical protein ACRDZW_01180, partial [Acidimicrobiales bacterium]
AAVVDRVSVATGGGQVTGVITPFTAISGGDGRYVAFTSDSGSLVPGDTNAAVDVFVHDRQTRTTTRVSVASGGAQADGQSLFPSISDDGRIVAFYSEATNLVPGDTNAFTDAFVHDRQTGTTTRVSVKADGSQITDFAVLNAVVSGNGRFVVFETRAANIVAGDVLTATDTFVYDRQTSSASRVSVATGGTEGVGAGTGAPLTLPSISGDGRYVAFVSTHNNLVAGDTNARADLFVHDRQTTTTVRASVATGDVQTTGGAIGRVALSGDGRYVAFSSTSANLVAGDTNLASDTFLFDRQTVTTTRISVGANGAESPAGGSIPAISADGRYVAFETSAGLEAGDSNSSSDIYVYDRQAASVSRASLTSGGQQADGPSVTASITNDGRYVGFSSSATNLVPGDTNAAPDVFVADRTLTTAVPAGSAGYRLVASDGGIFAFGGAGFFGSTGAIKLNRPIVGAAATPSGRGYWLVASDGGIFAFGDAGFFGSGGGTAQPRPIVGMASTPTGKGYWLVASDGGVFPFGDAAFLGSTRGTPLVRPIVAIAPSPSGRGYRLVASDGGIFAYGDAGFFGSTGALRLNKPIVGMASSPSGRGYWLVASDGGIFAFGDAVFVGSTGAQ